ncbi:21245_t:CDS:2 [Rhizophagus irregularis]|nr:21245_t:CDS:2 [Rhizophagus irregularis]
MATILQRAGRKCYQKIDTINATNRTETYKRSYDIVSSIINDRNMINKDAVHECFGESTRNSIDDACEIMSKWQIYIMDEYERRYCVKYAAFSHMFYDADSNDNIKSNLLEISREFGNVEFDEMQLMVVYRSARNKVTHKRIWKPDETFVLPVTLEPQT